MTTNRTMPMTSRAAETGTLLRKGIPEAAAADLAGQMHLLTKLLKT